MILDLSRDDETPRHRNFLGCGKYFYRRKLRGKLPCNTCEEVTFHFVHFPPLCGKKYYVGVQHTTMKNLLLLLLCVGLSSDLGMISITVKTWGKGTTVEFL